MHKVSTSLGHLDNAKKAIAIWAKADNSGVFAEISGWHRRQERHKSKPQKLFVTQWFDDEGTNTGCFGSLSEALLFNKSIDYFYGHIVIEDGYNWQRLKFLGGELAANSGQMLVKKDSLHPLALNRKS